MFIDTKIGYSDIITSQSNEQKPNFAQISVANNMESKLIVNNFGPIKHVDLDLRNVNVFIGPQATGKSALAKIYTIFKAPRKFFYKNDVDKNVGIKLDHEIASKDFADVLEDYNIKSFLKIETEIQFDSELHTFSYKKGAVFYEPKLRTKYEALKKLMENFKTNRNEIVDGLLKLADKFIVFSVRATDVLRKEGEDKGEPFLLDEVIDRLDEANCPYVIEVIKSIEEDLSANTALYIPAERNFSNIVKKSALNLILNKVPIPKHVLSFGAELEKLELKEIPLKFIQEGLVYKVIDGEDMVYTEDNHSIMLNEAASGIQSVVPVLLPILSRKGLHHRSFVIEEPELNLFPDAQYELIQILESNRRESRWEDWGTIHTYTTHSPYILSALNNLLYANKVRKELNARNRRAGNTATDSEEKNNTVVKEIVKAEINPDSFTAYQICNGSAESIFNRETGLIEDNYIDDASDKINEDFEALMELTK